MRELSKHTSFFILSLCLVVHLLANPNGEALSKGIPSGASIPRYLDGMQLLVQETDESSYWTTIPKTEAIPEGWQKIQGWRDIKRASMFFNLKTSSPVNQAAEIVFIRETNLRTGEIIETQQVEKSGEYETTMQYGNGIIRVEIWRLGSHYLTPKLEQASSIGDDSIRIAIGSFNGQELRSGELMRVGVVVDTGDWLMTAWGEDDQGEHIEDYGWMRFADGQLIVRRSPNLAGRDCFAVFKIDAIANKFQLVALNKISVRALPSVTSNLNDNGVIADNHHYILKGKNFDEDSYVEIVLNGQIIHSTRRKVEWEIWLDSSLIPLASGEEGIITVTSQDVYTQEVLEVFKQKITKQ